MAQLTIKINGYAYTVGCEDGQEAHLQDMAGQIQQRVDSIKALGGNPTGEGKLLVLAALLMADELHDSAIELNTLRQARAALPVAEGEPNGAAKPDDGTEMARAAARERRLSRLARKAEDIAASMEPS